VSVPSGALFEGNTTPGHVRRWKPAGQRPVRVRVVEDAAQTPHKDAPSESPSDVTATPMAAESSIKRA